MVSNVIINKICSIITTTTTTKTTIILITIKAPGAAFFLNIAVTAILKASTDCSSMTLSGQES